MAIQDDNSQQQQSAGLGAGLGGFQQQKQEQRFDLHDALSSMTGAFVAGGTGGDVFAKMRDEVTKVIADLTKQTMKNRIIPVNREDYRELKFSFLILASQMADEPTFVSYYIMILEGTGERLKPEIITLDNRQVKINRVTGHAYDARMQDLAHQIIQTEYPNTSAISAAAVVIHDTVLPTDSNKIKDISRNGILACVSRLTRVSKKLKPLRLDQIGQNYRFLLEMAHNPQGVVMDEQGAPMRSNALLSLSSEKKGVNRTNEDIVNRVDASERICELSGFVNTIWAPAQQQIGFGFSQMNGMMTMQNGVPVLPTQKLAAEFVITSLRTPYSVSTAAVILGLANMLLASDGNNWMQLLIPRSAYGNNQQRATGRNADLTDLGALNIIVNFQGETDKNGYGTMVEMEKLSGNLTELSRYITTIYRQGLIMSLDVPECGNQSWYLNVFGRAATGDKSSIQELLAAADEVTAGNFSTFFDASMPIFSNMTRVPLGFYRYGDQVRDIRDIDLTAICNLCKNSPDAIHNWNRAFADTMLNPYTRLAMVEEIISHSLFDQCEINGYAMRCSFSRQFIEALSKGFAALKLQTAISTPINRDQMQTGIQAPSYIDSALAGNTNTFNNMGANFGQSMNFTSGFGNRFF